MLNILFVWAPVHWSVWSVCISGQSGMCCMFCERSKVVHEIGSCTFSTGGFGWYSMAEYFRIPTAGAGVVVSFTRWVSSVYKSRRMKSPSFISDVEEISYSKYPVVNVQAPDFHLHQRGAEVWVSLGLDLCCWSDWRRMAPPNVTSYSKQRERVCWRNQYFHLRQFWKMHLLVSRCCCLLTTTTSS